MSPSRPVGRFEPLAVREQFMRNFYISDLDHEVRAVEGTIDECEAHTGKPFHALKHRQAIRWGEKLMHEVLVALEREEDAVDRLYLEIFRIRLERAGVERGWRGWGIVEVDEGVREEAEAEGS